MKSKPLNRMSAGLVVLAISMLTAGGSQAADQVVRHKAPNSDFPVAQGVEVKSGADRIYLSGTVPSVVNKSADKHTPAAYGDTKMQTRNVLKSIASKLQRMGYDMGDVVKMHAFIASDPKTGKVDFDGFMDAYTEFFGTKKQPNLPARTAVHVPQMINPGWLVEIEVTAAK